MKSRLYCTVLTLDRVWVSWVWPWPSCCQEIHVCFLTYQNLKETNGLGNRVFNSMAMLNVWKYVFTLDSWLNMFQPKVYVCAFSLYHLHPNFAILVTVFFSNNLLWRQKLSVISFEKKIFFRILSSFTKILWGRNTSDTRRSFRQTD